MISINDIETVREDSGTEVANTFLVEPLQATTSVVKYSGTFKATTRTDKLSTTISGFAHYIAVQTACKLIFVDLQGKYSFKFNIIFSILTALYKVLTILIQENRGSWFCLIQSRILLRAMGVFTFLITIQSTF